MKLPRPRLAGIGGFTLIELVVVVLILAILAGVIVPVIGAKVDQSRNTAALGTMKEIANAFNQYHIDTSAWPSNTPAKFQIQTSSHDLYDYRCLYTNRGNKANWNGPYLNDGVQVSGEMRVALKNQSDGLLDPWRSPFRVFNFAEGYQNGQGAIVLVSRGQNGILDTTDKQAFAGTPQKDDLLYVVTRKLAIGANK